MKALIAAILGLSIAVAITLMVIEDNGYVLISYGHWSVEGSLVMLAIALVLSYLAILILSKVIGQIFGSPGQLKKWRARKAAERARHALNRGLIELAEGNWSAGEKRLIKYVRDSESPLLNYLAAARAAQLQGAHERRDDYLQLAHEHMPTAELAIGLTQAELQLAHRQYEQSMATLMHLRKIAPNHPYVLKLLKRLYINLGEWPQLARILPELRRQKILSELELYELELSMHQAQIDKLSGQPERLSEYWEGLSKTVQQNAGLTSTYAQHLSRQGRHDQAVILIQRALNHEWNDELVALYGKVLSSQAADQLSQGEKWLRRRPDDAGLNLTLARLCLKQKIWGKGRSYLDAAIKHQPSAEAYRVLGWLHQQQREPEQAMKAYHLSLELSLGEDASLSDTSHQAGILLVAPYSNESEKR